jgi:hypothetical protein
MEDEDAHKERKRKVSDRNKAAYQEQKKAKVMLVGQPQINTEPMDVLTQYLQENATDDGGLYIADLDFFPTSSFSQETSHAFDAEGGSLPVQPPPPPLCPPPFEDTPRQDPPTEYVPISLVHVFSAFTFRITRTSCCPTEHIGVRSARRRTISFCLATHGDSNCFFCSASFRTETAAGFFAR